MPESPSKAHFISYFTNTTTNDFIEEAEGLVIVIYETVG